MVSLVFFLVGMSTPLKGGPKGLEREPPAVGAKMYKATQSIRKHCKSIKLHKKHKTQDQGYIAITQTRIRKPKKTSGSHGKQWNSMRPPTTNKLSGALMTPRVSLV